MKTSLCNCDANQTYQRSYCPIETTRKRRLRRIWLQWLNRIDSTSSPPQMPMRRASANSSLKAVVQALSRKPLQRACSRRTLMRRTSIVCLSLMIRSTSSRSARTTLSWNSTWQRARSICLSCVTSRLPSRTCVRSTWQLRNRSFTKASLRNVCMSRQPTCHHTTYIITSKCHRSSQSARCRQVSQCGKSRQCRPGSVAYQLLSHHATRRNPWQSTKQYRLPSGKCAIRKGTGTKRWDRRMKHSVGLHLRTLKRSSSLMCLISSSPFNSHLSAIWVSTLSDEKASMILLTFTSARGKKSDNPLRLHMVKSPPA